MPAHKVPTRLETIMREVQAHVAAVRERRIADEGECKPAAVAGKVGVKICPGFERLPHALPLTRENFSYRSSRKTWRQMCRTCKKAKRAAERAVKVAA